MKRIECSHFGHWPATAGAGLAPLPTDAARIEHLAKRLEGHDRIPRPQGVSGMSLHEVGDRLTRQIFLSLPMGLEERPLARPGDQDRPRSERGSDCPDAFRRAERARTVGEVTLAKAAALEPVPT